MLPSAYHRLAYRLFGGFARKTVSRYPALGLSLWKGDMPYTPDAYLGLAYLNMVVAGAATAAVPALFLVLGLATGLALPPILWAIFVPLPVIVALLVYVTSLAVPALAAGTRARDIDANLPYALSFTTILASAGVPPARILENLGQNEVFGQVAREAARITRDVKVFGKDLLTALSDAIDRSPSSKFQDFLQGAITSITSGVELHEYFLNKSEQYFSENRQEQRQFLENLGLLAESFVVVVVAAPSFMIVLLSVMVTGNAAGTLVIMYLLVLVIIPLAQLGFGVAIKSSTPEA